MFNRLYTLILFLLIFVHGVNALAVGGVIDYKSMWWIDMVLHFLGGVLLTIFAFWFFFGYKKYRGDFGPAWLLALGFVSFAVFFGVLWEFFEFLWDYFLSHPYGVEVAQPDLKDTMSDLFFDVLGAISAALLLFGFSRRK